ARARPDAPPGGPVARRAGDGLPVRAGGRGGRVLLQRPHRPHQRAVGGLHARQLDGRLLRAGAVRRRAAEHADRGARDDRGHPAGGRRRLRDGALPVPRPRLDQPPDLPAAGDARGGDGLVAAGAVRQRRRTAGLRHDPHRARAVLHQLRRGGRQGAAGHAGPPAGGGGGRPVRRAAADLPAGDAAAVGPRHRCRCPARLRAVLRRLHRHQLHRGVAGDVPHVRLGRGAARSPAAGERDRRGHVPRRARHRAAGRRGRPGTSEGDGRGL
ncbi:MAG: Putrescine transport system permease protein PotI, partial [uncultured Pseudonocardia sp.]